MLNIAGSFLGPVRPTSVAALRRCDALQFDCRTHPLYPPHIRATVSRTPAESYPIG